MVNFAKNQSLLKKNVKYQSRDKTPMLLKLESILESNQWIFNYVKIKYTYM